MTGGNRPTNVGKLAKGARVVVPRHATIAAVKKAVGFLVRAIEKHSLMNERDDSPNAREKFRKMTTLTYDLEQITDTWGRS